jgi:hypothetical protein
MRTQNPLILCKRYLLSKLNDTNCLNASTTVQSGSCTCWDEYPKPTRLGDVESLPRRLALTRLLEKVSIHCILEAIN